MDERGDVYTELRDRALAVSVADLGLTAAPPVLGVVMDTRYPEAVATLIGLADGTTSLYFSNGGGMIGGGQHPQVAEATRRWLEVAAELADRLSQEADEQLPGEGTTQLTVLTPSGRRSASAPEGELGAGGHELSPLFYAAHDVITELRLVEERGTS
jgi:hypothetical protein